MTARVLGIAQEVLNSGEGKNEWVSSNAAKILLGLTGGREFYNAAEKYGWTKKYINSEGRRSRPQVFYKYSDLESYANETGIEIGAYMRGWLEMIVWADSLTSMPTIFEIEDHVVAPYTVQSLQGLIETRQYRGLPSLEAGRDE